jgi:uncharacterized protein (DUF2345 family)
MDALANTAQQQQQVGRLEAASAVLVRSQHREHHHQQTSGNGADPKTQSDARWRISSQAATAAVTSGSSAVITAAWHRRPRWRSA